MKYFVADVSGKEEILGSAGATKRFLKAHPEVQSVSRYWWSGDLIEVTEFTREQILRTTTRQLSKGETAQWACSHGRLR